MGLLDKAKAAMDSAKQKVDGMKAAKEAEAIALENDGLTPEEIAAKDEAKKVITFKELYYGPIDVELVMTRGLQVKFTNTSERRIKYLHLTILILNRVGDVIHKTNHKAEGPFEPGKKGTYKQDRPWGLNDSNFEDILLDSVRIEYFEGDDCVINEKWLNRLVKKSNVCVLESLIG
jgi:hypothetical protein